MGFIVGTQRFNIYILQFLSWAKQFRAFQIIIETRSANYCLSNLIEKKIMANEKWVLVYEWDQVLTNYTFLYYICKILKYFKCTLKETENDFARYFRLWSP